MSSIINKVKEALHSDKDETTHSSTTHNTTGTHASGTHTTSGAPEGSYGPHGSRVANAADPRVDSDRDGAHPGAKSHTNYGEHGSSTGGYTHGTGIGLGNAPDHEGRTRVDDGPHNNNYGSSHGGYTQGTGPTHGSHNTGLNHNAGSAGPFAHNTTSSGTREGEHGPHGNRAANALDPRVDSDRDGSHNAGAAYGSSNTHTGTGNPFGQTTHTTGAHTGTGNPFGSSGTREGEHGPHGNRAANALDPRVDSDRDGSHNAGAAYGSSNTHTGTGNTFGSSTHNTGAHTGTSGYTTGSNTAAREGEHGPHSSRTANALDPRVDSDRDGSRNAGAAYGSGNTHTGTGNTFGSSTHTGGNQFGTTGTGHDNSSGLGHTGHTGPGPAPNTAGPHKSDMVNKLDPRVDSDLDGSKTVGGNKTYQSGAQNTGLGHRDPTDAAQVPPSVLQQTIGAPVVAHDDHHHGRERRNSSATHQETYRGV